MIVRPCAASWAPSWRRLQRSAALDEKRLADPRLQHGERPADGRLGQAEHRGTFRHAAGIQHRGELHQMALVQLHSKMLYKRAHNSSSIGSGRAIPFEQGEGRPRAECTASMTAAQRDRVPRGDLDPGRGILAATGRRRASHALRRRRRRPCDGLHALIAELRPSSEEFRLAIDFLTEVGHYADARRQEWVLFADVLGVSSLIEDQNSPRPAGATPNTRRRAILSVGRAGDAARRQHLARPQGRAAGGRRAGSSALDGEGVGGAIVEIWQANAEGLYENQEPDRQPEFNLRGRFRDRSAGALPLH